MLKPGKSPLRPLGDYIVVQEVKEDTTRGGIVLPDGARVRRVLMGIVVEVGEGELMYNLEMPRPSVMTLKPGNKVLFSPNHPPIEWEKETFFIFREGEIYAVLK